MFLNIIKMFLDTNILLRLNALSIMRSDPSCLLRLPTILSETSSDSDYYAHCISFRNTKIFVSLRFRLYFHAWEIITIIVILDLYSGKQLAAIHIPLYLAHLLCVFCPCIEYMVLYNNAWKTMFFEQQITTLYSLSKIVISCGSVIKYIFERYSYVIPSKAYSML